MVDLDYLEPIEVPGFRLAPEPRLHAASLRYFEREGVFARLVQDAAGLKLPNERAAAHRADGAHLTIFAWRSPSETTLISSDAEWLDSLQSTAAAVDDGCIVDLRGGTWVFRARGNAVANIVARTAGHGAMPAIGESRRTRLAEVPVQMVKVQADGCLMIVDRIYAPHVLALLRQSAADLGTQLYD